SLQLTLLLVIWLAGLVSSMLLHEPPPRSAPIVFVLLVVSSLAGSDYAGYFCAILPFVLADVVVLVTAVRSGLAESRGLLARQLPHSIAFFAALYVIVAPIDMFAFTFGVDSPGT